MAFLTLWPGWLAAAPSDDLVEAARNGQIARVQALVAAGADVNKPNAREGSALNAAAASDEPEMVKWLLAHGAKPNPHAKCGEWSCLATTPLPDSSAIAHFDLLTQKMDLVASTRRQPSESPLDDPALAITALSLFGWKQLLITSCPKTRQSNATGLQQHLWSPTTREWRKMPDLSPSFPQPVPPGFSQSGWLKRANPNKPTSFSDEVADPNYYIWCGTTGRIDLRFDGIGRSGEGRPTSCAQCPAGLILPFLVAAKVFGLFLNRNRMPINLRFL